MSTLRDIEARRNYILREISEIRSMKRGTVSEQFLKGSRKGQEKPVLRGPYYLFQRREGKRVVSQRLTSKKEVEQARDDVAAHKRFVQLCQEFEQLTEQLGELERRPDAAPPEKKRRKSRSNKIEK